jgi:RNA polymerase sigma-70 factor (ECF subfamily)
MEQYNLLTDSQLTDRLKENDKNAYEEIYSRFKGILFTHAFRMLQDTEEAKDVLQEIFAVLWTKRNQLNFTVSLSAYLYAATRNRIFDLISRKKAEYLSLLIFLTKQFTPQNAPSAKAHFYYALQISLIPRI